MKTDLLILDEAFRLVQPTIIRKAKPPNGCAWVVLRDETTITLRAVTPDGESQVEVSGDYCNVTTGEWRDPREVAERLAQVVLFGCVLEKINRFKGTVKSEQEV